MKPIENILKNIRVNDKDNRFYHKAKNSIKLLTVIFIMAAVSGLLASCNQYDDNKNIGDDNALIENSLFDNAEYDLDAESSVLANKDEIFKMNIDFDGGSGKAHIKSPVTIEQKDDKYMVTLEWNSPNYDYMIVDGVKYFPVNDEGDSVFVIEISDISGGVNLVADTVAMSKPHEIEYSICFIGEKIYEDDEINNSDNLVDSDSKTEVTGSITSVEDINKRLEYIADNFKISYVESLNLDKAVGFSVDFLENGYALITIEKMHYLMVPEEKSFKDVIEDDLIVNNSNNIRDKNGEILTIIPKNAENIYLGASAVMDFYYVLNRLDKIKMTSTSSGDFSNESVAKEIKNGNITYVGKYSSPDYELILDNNCDFCIENMMIYHCPETKEQLENIGIPVLVERSSYEPDPMGRLEWIKLFGLLSDSLNEAEIFYDGALDNLNKIAIKNTEEKEVLFFYVSSNGRVAVRTPEDYISKMIEMAGGIYKPSVKDVNGLKKDSTTINMQMENFYDIGIDADYIIYNSTILGEIKSIDDLLKLNPLFADFKAVKGGNVWCSNANMYQQTSGISDMILELNSIFNDSKEDLEYFKKID